MRLGQSGRSEQELNKTGRDRLNRELEYLIRVYTDSVRAGTVKGFARKASARVQRFAGGNTVSGSLGLRSQWKLGTEGNQLGKRNKRQDALVENCRKEWECMHVGELQHHQPASSVSHWIKWEC